MPVEQGRKVILQVEKVSSSTPQYRQSLDWGFQTPGLVSMCPLITAPSPLHGECSHACQTLRVLGAALGPLLMFVLPAPNTVPGTGKVISDTAAH